MHGSGAPSPGSTRSPFVCAAALPVKAPPYDGADDFTIANCKELSDVAALLEANLTDVHVYRFSEGKPGDDIEAPGQVSVFIAGRAASGGLVGVMTAAVET